jgi:exopolyphosphatase/guanosine-5'-triphosphate,3'-diphosphate pyrophosphatase
MSNDIIQTAAAFARSCGYDEGHSRQDARLALDLFDQLAPLHKLGPDDRLLLHCAALLHDIGVPLAAKDHHKTAMRMILADRTLPLRPRRRRLVALIARCHRKNPPGEHHPDLEGLPGGDLRRLRLLAGILRVADGLDRSHRSLVTAVRCTPTPGRLAISCGGVDARSEEIAFAREKSDMLAEALGRQVRIVAGRRPG